LRFATKAIPVNSICVADTIIRERKLRKRSGRVLVAPVSPRIVAG